MWRRSDSRIPLVLAWGVLAAQAAAAAVVLAALLLRAIGVLGAPGLQTAVAYTAGAALACVVAAAAWLVLAPMQQEFHHRRSARKVERWIGKWVMALLERELAVPTPLPLEAQTALLTLQERLKGEDAEALKEVAQRYQLGEQFLKFLHPTRTELCLDALEALAKVKLADTLPSVLDTMVRDGRAPVRRAAARAAARTIADMPEGAERELACFEFAHCMTRASLSVGVQQEALGLLGSGAGKVLGTLLSRDELPEGLFRATLETAGRARLVSQAARVARAVEHPRPEVRAAALRALWKMGHVPQGLEHVVRAGLRDAHEGVRAQAARAACLLPAEEASRLLWMLLGDRAYWVRRAAAYTLRSLDEGAPHMLRRASREHPNAFARDIAAHFVGGGA